MWLRSNVSKNSIHRIWTRTRHIRTIRKTVWYVCFKLVTLLEIKVLSCGSWGGRGLLVSMIPTRALEVPVRHLSVLMLYIGISTHAYYQWFHIVLVSWTLITGRGCQKAGPHIHSAILSLRSSHLSPETVLVQTVPPTPSRQVLPPNYRPIATAVSSSIFCLFHSISSVSSPFPLRCLFFILEMV